MRQRICGFFVPLLHRLARRRGEAADGEVVRLGAKDMVALALHYATLSPEDRYARFNGRTTFAALLKRYRTLNDERQIFLGIFDCDRLIGVCEIGLDPADTHGAEIALSVRGPWQGRHYGHNLLRRALDIVRAEGRRPYMITRLDNAPLIRLAEAEGGKPERSGLDVEISFPDV